MWLSGAIAAERGLAPADNHLAPVSGVLVGSLVGGGLGTMAAFNDKNVGWFIVGAAAGAVGGYFLGDATRDAPIGYYVLQVPITTLLAMVF